MQLGGQRAAPARPSRPPRPAGTRRSPRSAPGRCGGTPPDRRPPAPSPSAQRPARAAASARACPTARWTCAHPLRRRVDGSGPGPRQLAHARAARRRGRDGPDGPAARRRGRRLLPRAPGAGARAAGRRRASRSSRPAATATRCCWRSPPTARTSSSATSGCRRPRPTRASRSPRGCARPTRSIGVVILSQFTDPRYGLALLESGSDGRAYLLKERIRYRGQLVAAIESVAEGGSVIDAKVVEALVRARHRSEHSPLNQLTARELEILTFVARGHSQPGDRRRAGPDQARGREAHQRDLPEARADRRGRRRAARQGRADLPRRAAGRADLEQAELGGAGDGGRARADAELAVDRVDLRLDGVGRDVLQRADLAAGQVARQAPQDAQLGGGERRQVAGRVERVQRGGALLAPRVQAGGVGQARGEAARLGDPGARGGRVVQAQQRAAEGERDLRAEPRRDRVAAGQQRGGRLGAGARVVVAPGLRAGQRGDRGDERERRAVVEPVGGDARARALGAA